MGHERPLRPVGNPFPSRYCSIDEGLALAFMRAQMSRYDDLPAVDNVVRLADEPNRGE